MNKRPTCAVFIACSVDGYIARANGDVDWLQRPQWETAEDLGYERFIASVDTLIMGRHSFEKVLTFGEWPYSVPVVVLSSRENVVPEHLDGRVSFSNLSPADIVVEQAAQGAQKLYIDGGITIQRFLAAGLIDELIITYIPILLGDGIRLFGDGRTQLLTLVEATNFDNGFVQVSYRPSSD